MHPNKMIGIDQNVFFFGVVEDRNDPLKLGRVKVRIMGMHSELKVGDDETGEGIPTYDLPWGMPLQSITSAAMNGIGNSPTGIVEGSHVFGYAIDGRFMNNLLIIGTIGGIPQELPNGQIGFNDPNNIYPKKEFIGEQDTNRLSRNEKIEETILKLKEDSLDRSVGRANGIGAWDEPSSPYNAKYPYNHVKESESGHVIEIDDTEGAERIHEYHRTGTFREVHPDGSKVTKIVGDDFEIIQKNKHLHVRGNISITVDGDADILVNGNVEEQVKKNVNRVVEGNVTELVKGSLTRTIEGDVSETFKSSKTLDVTGSDSETSGTKSSTVSGSETNKAASYNVDGAVSQNGGYTVTGDVAADGISLKDHIHNDTIPGTPSPTTKPI